ncbi:hypothetical protein RPE78_08590 [Thioclava litoralis]|uniref:Uncharacterized protein n=1 Tax=Thioclava litoralis TaxID=3076557 RepID=A0ABZ1DWI8_9RHOB|nr:hypothetical protein RPE78_08590 [Thioclava sp. FTW29]
MRASRSHSGRPSIPRRALAVTALACLPLVWAVIATRDGQLTLPITITPRDLAAFWALILLALWAFRAAQKMQASTSLLLAHTLPFFATIAAIRAGLPVMQSLFATHLVTLILDLILKNRRPEWWARLRLGESLLILACLYALIP